MDIPFNKRGLGSLFAQVHQASGLSTSGLDNEPSMGNPIILSNRELKRWCTARITGIATQSDGSTPLLDDQGCLQYTWVEEQRYYDGVSPDWQDNSTVPLDMIRGSITDAPGIYRNLAHNANEERMPPSHVIMWAGCQISEMDWEHVFYEEDRGFAVAQSDWVMGTWRTTPGGTDDYVVVKQCEDMDGLKPFGPTFNVYFYQRQGGYDPAIFGPRSIGYPPVAVPGDVIMFQYDYVKEAFFCTSADSYDDQLGCVKFFVPTALGDIGSGWWPCDGTTPANSKIGAVPDTRGLFTRALETQGDTLWIGGGTAGRASNLPGGAPGAGGNCGVSSSRVAKGDAAPNTPTMTVTQLEDIESWKGGAHDNSPHNPNDVVVCPPCFTMKQIIRCW
jgi:hypothetical protein